MTANQDISKKVHLYNSEDRQLLVDLLHEYSVKLVEASRAVARNNYLPKEDRSSSLKSTTFFYFVCVFSTSLSYLLWQLLSFFAMMKANEFKRYSDLIRGEYESQWIHAFLRVIPYNSSFINIVVTAVLLLPISLWMIRKSNLLSLFYSIRTHRSQLIEIGLKERDARMIANRLESAMRLTVEVADQVETNLARKLELDLRIDDASYALEYYYSVVGAKNKDLHKHKKPSPSSTSTPTLVVLDLVTKLKDVLAEFSRIVVTKITKLFARY
jgi:hypothetical protein